MRSSVLYYWLGRWGLIGLAFGFGAIAVQAALQNDTFLAIGFALALIGLLGFGIWLHDRIAVVSLDEMGASIQRGGVVEQYEWSEIAHVRLIPQTRPPAYEIIFRSGTPSAYCVVTELYVGVEFMGINKIKDLSGFGEFAQEQVLKASIESEKARMKGRSNPEGMLSAEANKRRPTP